MKYKNQKGFSALIVVLVIGAVGLIFVKNLSLQSLEKIDWSQAMENGRQANLITNGCLRDGLSRLKQNNNLIMSNKIITISGNHCTLDISSIAGGRKLSATAVFNNHTDTTKADISVTNGIIRITNWY